MLSASYDIHSFCGGFKFQFLSPLATGDAGSSWRCMDGDVMIAGY